uniref:Intermediate filament tail domain protein n=1 Tax=Syphacia muris TaxID=451379 RepID=A0A0N5A832_9BILA
MNLKSFQFGPDRRRTMSSSSQHAATSIRDEREREKKEISELNDRFASYIEKVRFLDAQNRKMIADLKMFSARIGSNASTSQKMHEAELEMAKKIIADTEAERLKAEVDIPKLSEEIIQYQKRYNDVVRARQTDRNEIVNLIIKFSELDGERNLLRRRIEEVEDEVKMLKKDNYNLASMQSRLASDREQESLARIDAESRIQMLREELEFTRREQELELKDLQASMVRDTTTENREYFKSELANAIRGIREEYDNLVVTNRNDMEKWYKVKMQEFQSSVSRKALEQNYVEEEVKRLRTQFSDIRTKVANFEEKNSFLSKQVIDMNNQLEDEQKRYELALEEREKSIQKLREESEALVQEFQRLLDTKETLEQEILTYRELLEGEETRAGLRRIIQQDTKETLKEAERITSEGGTSDVKVITNKITFHGTSKGQISIQETSIDGKFIVLANSSKTNEISIGGWKIKRNIDNTKDVEIKLPEKLVLSPMKTVKIWANNQGGTNNPPSSIVISEMNNFGSGWFGKTVLINAEGEEVAEHIQKCTPAMVGN